MFQCTRENGLYRISVEFEMISSVLRCTSTETTRNYATSSIEMLGEAMNKANFIISDESPEQKGKENKNFMFISL